MKTNYQVNVRKLSHKNRNRTLLIYLSSLALVVLFSWLIFYFFINHGTKINNSKPKITKIGAVSLSSNNLKTYSASDFTFKMSPGWISVPIANSSYHIYEWQSGKGANYQTVDVFEDSNTANFAVNRIIIVSPNVSQISVLGPPSDNCANFTNGHKTSTTVGYPAKWQGVAFNCDLNSPTRDTIGISSAQAINSVNLTSPTNAHHSFYFLLTDHSLTPNYSDFEELLSNFALQ